MSDENPSVHEANKVLRVLSGEKQKFTVRVHRKSGEIIEFQTDTTPSIRWDEQMRCLALCMYRMGSGGDHTIMKWEDGDILLSEPNP